MIYSILYVAIGGAIGSVARYLISRATQNAFATTLPVATLIVNVLGCFIIGMLYAIFARHTNIDANLRLMLTVGFCGGFTTFSTFMNENFNLINSGNILTCALYIGISVALGFVGVWGGAIIGNRL